LRLAVVSPFVDRRHGTERALSELLERLAGDYGCEVHLYAQRVEDLRMTLPEAAQDADSAAPRGPVGRIHWHRVPAVPGPHVVQFLGWMLFNGFCRRRDAWLSRTSCDLLLSPGINCLHPNVIIVHALFHRLRGLAEEAGEQSAEHSGILRRWHRRIYYGLLTALERKIYGNRNIKIAAVSKRTAELLKQYCHREDVAIVPNGVDTVQFCPKRRLARREQARRERGFRSEECVLLLIGNDWRTKGLPTVLHAVATLQQLPLRLLVVGSDGPEYFQRQAAQLGLRGRCIWERPRPEVIDLYAAADIYVSPSREDSFGLPVAEAMACGLPIITSRFAGVAELVQDRIEGFVLEDPENAQTLAQWIALLATDADLRRNVGAAAAARAAGFTWERQASAVWKLLQSKVEHDAISNR
jgi:glycosyltransferase involved in cell wall biosynthesis